MKRKIDWRLVLAFCLLVSACSHPADDVQPAIGSAGGTSNNGTGGTGGTGTGGITPADTALCFERDILPILASNCAKSGCHDAASAQEGYVFTNYQTITSKKFSPGDPDETELYGKITETKKDKIMPPPPNAPLTPQQIGLVYRWIKSGAPNTTGCATGCDEARFTFAATVQPLLNKNCKGCHNTTGASGGVNLESYAGVQAVAQDGRLLGAVKHQAGYSPMPKSGNQLSNCQIVQIEKWVLAGAQNN